MSHAVAVPGIVLLAAGVALALLLARVLWLRRRPPALEVFAAALVAYPVARALVGAAAVAERLTRYTVLEPAPRAAFELAIVRDVGLGLLLPLAGALLLWRSRAGRGAVRDWRGMRAAVAKTLEPAGVRLAGPLPRGLFDGLALLALAMLLQAIALVAQSSVAAVLVTGDESRYWQNLDLALLVGLSLAAGLSEEFVWRGLFLRGLMTRMAWVPALLLQAALFGFIHAGYGNWAHVLGPALFGGLMGLVALRVSLLAAVVVHAGIDVMYLAIAAPHLQPFAPALTGALLLAGVVAMVVTRGRGARALLVRGGPVS